MEPKRLCAAPERPQRRRLTRPQCDEVAAASAVCNRLAPRRIPPAACNRRSWPSLFATNLWLL
jgi:hypothetical protein